MRLLSRFRLAFAGAIAGFAQRHARWENPANPVIHGLSNAHDFWGCDDFVSSKQALGYAPLFQAVSMISGDCAKLPINVYGPTKLGRSVLSKHPVQQRIHRNGRPNPELNGFKFWRRFYISACLWQNAYAWIDRNNRGEVIGLYQLLPDRTFMQRVNGVLQCVTQTTKGTKYLIADDVLHVEGVSIDGLSGLNLIQQFRKDFLIALAAQDFKVRFFRNNMMAGGVLQAKPGTKPSTIRRMQKRIDENFSGSEKAFRTLILRDQFQWFRTQVNPAEAELTATDEQQVRQTARMFNIPGSFLGLKDSVSYNSEESSMHPLQTRSCSPKRLSMS